MGELRGRSAEARAEQAQHADGLPLQLAVAVDAGQAEQDEREHRVARGDRVVEEVLLARDEALALRRSEIEAAALLVREELDREQGQPARLLEPAQLAGGDVQFVKAAGHV